MATSPNAQPNQAISFQIFINGSAIPDSYQVYYTFVERNINSIPHCIIEIIDNESKSMSDSEAFLPGSELEIRVGYDGNLKTLFEGVIIEQSFRGGTIGSPVFTLLCKDKAIKMHAIRNSAYFKDTRDSDVMSVLISNHGLEANVESTGIIHKELIQYYVSDWDFIVARAEANGMVVAVVNGKVSVLKPGNIKDVTLSLTYGKDIENINVIMSAEHQFKEISASAWDNKQQKVIVEKIDVLNTKIGNVSSQKLAEVVGGNTFKLQSGGFLNKDMLNNWANAQGTKSEYAKIRGDVSFQGNTDVLPATLITLDGLSDRYNGDVFVSGVLHQIGDGQWMTKAQLGLSPEWYMNKVKTEAPITSGLLPGIQGLQLGIVQQIHDDPEREYRVLIKLPLIQSTEDGIWARLSTFHASANGGAFYYPEVGDEVVVGFMNDDPRYPIILGSMYSSKRPAHLSPNKENTIRGLVSNTGMKVLFDDTNKELTINTPNNNELLISDDSKNITLKDQHGNYIRLSSGGIEINSTSNLTINAKANIDLKGLNVDCKAHSAFSAMGNAQSSLKSSGILTVQGALVKIN